MTELNTTEQHITRSLFGGWQAVRAMGWDFAREREHAVFSMSSRSHVPGPDGREAHCSTTGKGLEWGPLGGTTELVITWQRIADHFAAHRTPDLVADCSAQAKASLQLQTDMKSYPQRWPGVPWALPLTSDGETWEDVDRWWHDVHMPAWRETRARESALLDRIYPATDPDAAPTDLFALLAASA